jgi:alpha-mannosidase
MTPLAACCPISAPPVRATLRSNARTLTNGLVTARFDPAGRISALRDPTGELDLAGPAGLVLFPDHPANYDAWDLDRPTMGNGCPVTARATAEVVEADGVQRVRFVCSVGTASRATVTYRLDPGSPHLRVQFDLDWNDPQALLKFVVPTGYRGREARFGAPFGSTLRPQHARTLADDAAFEGPASRWASVSDDTEREGLFLAARDLYGFGAHGGVLHVSLLRSARVTEPGLGANDSVSYTGDGLYADLGQSSAELVLGRHDASHPIGLQPAAIAETAFTAPIWVRSAGQTAGLLAIEGDGSLVPAWALPQPQPVPPTPPGTNSWTLRLHETMGRRGAVMLRLDPSWSAVRVRLDGSSLSEDATLEPLGGGVRIRFRPYEVISVQLSRQ